jgi:hypothetical protein
MERPSMLSRYHPKAPESPWGPEPDPGPSEGPSTVWGMLAVATVMAVSAAARWDLYGWLGHAHVLSWIGNAIGTVLLVGTLILIGIFRLLVALAPAVPAMAVLLAAVVLLRRPRH